MIGTDQFLHQHIELCPSFRTDTREQHPAFRLCAYCRNELPKSSLDTHSNRDFHLPLQFSQFGDKRTQIESQPLDDCVPKRLFRAKMVGCQCWIDARGRRDPTQTGALETMARKCGLSGLE